MDIRSMIDKTGELADMAAILVPQAKLVKGGTIVLNGILDVMDGLKKDAPDASSAAEIEKHRAKVADVQAKAARTSARLRGD
jgi:hypothetical protein